MKLLRLSLFSVLILLLVTSNLGLMQDDPYRKSILYGVFAVLLMQAICSTSKTGMHIFSRIFAITILIIFYEFAFKDIPILDDWILPLVMDVGMFLIGMHVFEKGDMKRLFQIYVSVCSIAALYSILSFDSSDIYGFGLKNNQAPIYLIASVLLVMNAEGFKTWLNRILLAINFLAIFSINSRSNMLGLVLIILYVIVKEWKNYKKYLRSWKVLLVASLCIIGIIRYIENLIQFFSVAFRLTYLRDEGLERYSSDRITMIKDGFKYFSGNEFLGIFNTYVAPPNFYIESFPIDCLVQLGIVGALLYFFWFKSVSYYLFRKNADIVGKMCFLVMMIVCCFESNAPLSPGTTWGFAWIMVGFYSAKSYYEYKSQRIKI